MIIGGTNAAGITDGMRTNYYEFFLPATCSVYGTGLLTTFTQKPKTSLNYTAFVRIRNVADTAWIYLGSATTFTVNLTTANLGTASVSLKQPEIWSPFYEGGLYPDVLRPSNRRCEIWCGITNNNSYPVPIFSGHIKSSKEALNGGNGQLNLELEDLRDTMQRTDVTPPPTNYYTSYFMLRYLVQQAISSGSTFAPVIFGGADGEISINTSGLTIDDIVNAIIAQGQPLKNITGSGVLDVSNYDDKTLSTQPVFTYDDAALIRLERTAGSNDFNTVNTYGINIGGVGVTGMVDDPIDVAKRGRLFYKAGYVGSPQVTIEQANATAAEMIAKQLDAPYTFEVQLNPYLTINQWVAVSSARADLDLKQGQILSLTHTYSASQQRSMIENWRGQDFTPITYIDPEAPDEWTKALLHLDSDQTDMTGRTWSIYGTPVFDTSQYKFGGKSLYCGEAGLLHTPTTSPDFDFSTNNWTIDFWARIHTDKNNNFAASAHANGYCPWLIGTMSGKWRLWASASGASWDIANQADLGTVVLDTWVHWAITYYGTSLMVFRNGSGVYLNTSVNSLMNPDTTVPNGNLTIGGYYLTGGVYAHIFSGWVDEFRVTNGIARWITNFSVPTAPY